MPWTTVGVNKTLNLLRLLPGQEISMHTGVPGETGANEVAGGGYARLAPTWAAADARNIDSTTTLDFTIPPLDPGEELTHAVWWVEGVPMAWAALPVAEEFPSGGVYHLLDADAFLP